MKKSRIIALLMCILMMNTLLFTFVGCGKTSGKESIPIPVVEENVYVYDQNDIITNEVEESINKLLAELEEKTEVEFAVISVESLLNRSIEEYANELFNTLGIGKDDKDNGVLLLFSRADGRVRIEIGLGLEGCLNDSKCGRILDNNFVPYREKDEYSTATELTVKAIVNEIAKEYELEIQGLENSEEIENVESNEEEKTLSTGELILIIIIAVYVIIIVCGDGGSSGSSYYGGGFSSGRSSRSSFGGGRSGGGGASR